MKRKKYPDKAGIAMILFGLALCASFYFLRQIWLIILGVAWVAIPLLLTKDDEEHFD